MRHLPFCVRTIALLACMSGVSGGFTENEDLNTQLVKAVAVGDEETVRSLLSQGARANIRPTERDETSLEAAFRHRQWRVAKLLMNAGIPPESLFPGDYQALSSAAQRGDRYLLRRLLTPELGDNGDRWHRRLDAWRLLTIAVLKEDQQMLQTLRECLSFDFFWFPPDHAWPLPLVSSIYFGKWMAFKELTSPSLPPERARQELKSDDHKSSTTLLLSEALMAAAEQGGDNYVNILLQINPAILGDIRHITPHAGTGTKDDPIMKVILGLQAATIKQLSDGLMPHHYPLIGRGNLSLPSWEDQVYDIWSNYGTSKIPSTSIWQAITKIHAMGSRPSHHAAFSIYYHSFQNGSLSAKEFEELLRPLGSWPLEFYNPSSLARTDDSPSFPLCWEAIGNSDTVRIMIRAGVPIKSWRDKKGRSLLHLVAYRSGESLIVESHLPPLVKEGGVDINARDATGQTALAYVRPLEGFIQFIDQGATIRWPGCVEGHALNRWVANHRNWEDADRGPWPDYKLLQHLKVAPLLNLAAGQDRRTPLTTACELPQRYLPRWGNDAIDIPKTPEEQERRKEEAKRAEQEEEKRWQSLRDPLITCLLDAGANANLPDGRGWTPARAAVESQDMVRLRTLIAHPKGLQCSDPEGLLKVLTPGSSFSRETLLVLLNKHGIACGQSPAPVDMAPPP